MIPLFKPLISPDVLAHVADAIQPDPDGRVWVGEGPTVKRFEAALAETYGVPGWLATNSCTAALYVALHSLGVGPGDEVVVTPMTCSLTSSPITMRHARPVWADVDPRTGLINPLDVARKVSRRTKAVVAVDFAGRRCDYWALRLAAPGIPIIQDAAHLAPEPLGERRGDWVALSFGAIKFLTTSDGGALLPPADGSWKHDPKRTRWAGLDRDSKESFRASQSINEPGGKWHMTDVAAAFGLANLPLAKAAVTAHRQNAAFYGEVLAHVPHVEIPPPDPRSSWWLYVLHCDHSGSLAAYLRERGIEASPVHRRNDVHPGFDYYSGRLPGVEWYAPRQLAIPTGWWVTPEDAQRVADAVIGWASSRG